MVGCNKVGKLKNTISSADLFLFPNSTRSIICEISALWWVVELVQTDGLHGDIRRFSLYTESVECVLCILYI